MWCLLINKQMKGLFVKPFSFRKLAGFGNKPFRCTYCQIAVAEKEQNTGNAVIGK